MRLHVQRYHTGHVRRGHARSRRPHSVRVAVMPGRVHVFAGSEDVNARAEIGPGRSSATGIDGAYNDRIRGRSGRLAAGGLVRIARRCRENDSGTDGRGNRVVQRRRHRLATEAHRHHGRPFSCRKVPLRRPIDSGNGARYSPLSLIVEHLDADQIDFLCHAVRSSAYNSGAVRAVIVLVDAGFAGYE